MFELLKELTELPGMVGQEEPVQDAVRKYWKSKCKEVVTTDVGNVIAHVGGSGKKLVIVGHADEIGVYVNGFTREGMVKVAPRWRLPSKPGRHVHYFGHPCLIQTESGNVEGFFATVTGHVVSDVLFEKPSLDWNDIWVDIGARNEEEAKAKGIQIGDGIVWSPPTRKVGNYITGKAMDNRAALVIMTELLERINPDLLQYDLYLASTIQEEVGKIGAFSLERDNRFDLAITLDVGLAGDIPGVDQSEINTRLGGGPILVYHSGVHYNRKLTKSLARIAAEENIPVQHAIFGRYSSDGTALIQVGVPSALVAFATRYTHSPYETLAEEDLELCVQLLKAFLENHNK